MNAQSPMLYTNEVFSAYLSSLDDHCFTEQQLAEFNEHALEVISQRQFYLKTHPAVAVYRVAAWAVKPATAERSNKRPQR
ncbi:MULTISPECIES: hypothetical protein [unclassified Pseudomonas]|uniref:hypothetical protein n=1 Tax=unclassified Pseudomonas TaxID=196821 RepID=UPI0030DAD080